MSATSSLDKARRVAAMYDQMGFTGVELLVINTTGQAWQDTFVFKVRSLIRRFQLPILAKNSHFKNEYLIQDEIPRNRVVRTSLYNVKSQCSEDQWWTAWSEAENLIRMNRGRKRKSADEGPEVVPRKKQSRTFKYRKVQD